MRRLTRSGRSASTVLPGKALVQTKDAAENLLEPVSLTQNKASPRITATTFMTNKDATIQNEVAILFPNSTGLSPSNSMRDATKGSCWVHVKDRLWVITTASFVLLFFSLTAQAGGFEFGTGVMPSTGMKEVNFNTNKGGRISIIPGLPIGLVEIRVTLTNGTIRRTSL